MSASQGWVITRLTVAGFRGFTKAQTFELANPCTIMFGENGTGKSSALNAIEWALFGKECVGQKTGIRERVGWEVRNRDGAHPTVVELEIRQAQQTVLVKRSSVQGTGAAKDKLVVKTANRELEGEQATEWLGRELPYSFRDFLTTIYQHQEVVREILVQTPSSTNDALDRLLGLSVYRNLLNGIKLARIDKAFKDASGKKDELAQRIQVAIDVREGDFRELHERAVSNGIDASDISLNGAVRRAERLIGDIRQFCREVGAGTEKIVLPTSLDSVDEFCPVAGKQIDRAVESNPDIAIIEELLRRRSAISQFREKLMDLVRRRLGARERADGFARTYSSKGELQNRIEGAERKRADLEGALVESNARAGLVREGMRFLESMEDDSPRADHCPLCGNQATNLLEELRAEWASRISGRTKEIEEEIEGVERELDALKKASSEWNEAERTFDSLGEELSALGRAVEEGLVVAVGGHESEEGLERILSRELEEVQRRLAGLEESVTKKRERASRLKEDIDKIKVIAEILHLEERLARLNELYEADEFRSLDSALGGMAQLAADVDTIRAAIAQVSNADAETKIKAATKYINDFFRKLANHPSVKNIVLDVSPSSITGQNDYDFTDDHAKDVRPILSQGNLNCLALSIFLGLASAADGSSPFGFLLLDDPSQSMGSAEKKVLAELLSETSEHRQVIIATMDSEFRDELLRRKFGGYEFAAWSPTGGPAICRLEKE